MSKYVLLKSVSGLISLKIPDESCIEYEVIPVVDEVTMSELILQEQKANPDARVWVAECRLKRGGGNCCHNPALLSLKQGDFYIVYKQKNILCVEASGSYSKVRVLNEKLITVTFNMAEIEAKLSEELFIRIHRSVIINVNYITKFIGNTLYLGEYTFPVGRKFKKALLMRLNLVGGCKKMLSEES